jgi:iron complex outermembrane receptor protein
MTFAESDHFPSPRKRLAAQVSGALTALAALALLGGGAHAETPTAPAATDAAAPAADADKSINGDAAIQSINVTATRRSASLQSVPVALSVLDGEELARSNRNGIDSIVQELPSVTFRQSGGNKDSTIFIRGVGTISTSPGVEPTVSTVIDGVVYARPGQATADLLDIDRLEVLRGPQGTLFGKNASSGVVSITSRKPTEETSGYVDASYYEGNEQRVRAGIAGTLVPGLVRASLTALTANYDGNVTNLYNGDKVNGYDRMGARARVDITPNRDVDISLIADYMHSNGSPTGAVLRATTPAFTTALLPATSGGRSVYNDIPNDIADINKGLSAQVDWRHGGYTLTSITAVRNWDNVQHTSTSVIGDSADLSRASAAFPATRDIGTLAYQQFSQELRIASPKERYLDYVAGLYYLHGHDSEDYRRIVTNTATSSDSGRAQYGVTSDSYSIFGEDTLHFTPVLRGILGGRWTRDELSYQENRVSTKAVAFAGVQPAFSGAGDTSKNGTSGRTGLQYDFDPDVTGYATYSRGYKGPAYNVFFNMLARDGLALQPETSNSYELGLKSSLFEHRLNVNLAAYLTKYANYQANFYDTVAGAVVTRLINAGDVSTRGVELDVTARPIRALVLNSSLAFTDAHIDSFNCPAAAAASCNLNGQPLPFSPRWKSFTRAAYTWPLPHDLSLELETDYAWQSKTQYDLFQSPDAIQGAYGIVNAGLTVASSTGGWRLSLVGKNLGNRSYATNITTGTGYVSRAIPRDDQRYVGVNLRKDF